MKTYRVAAGLFQLSALILCLLLAACVRAPERVPVAGVPYPGTWSAPATGGEPDLDAWWISFGDQALTGAINEALQSSPDLSGALARLDAAAAQARLAGATLLPAANLVADSQRRQQVFVGLPIPGRENEPLQSLSTTHGLSFNVNWELDLWGRVRAAQSAALAEVQASEEDYRAGLMSVAAQTAKAWLGAVEMARQRELAKSTADSYSVTAERVRERYRRGLRSALDLRLALNNEAVARAATLQREREYEISVRQLEILLGRYPSGRFEVPGVMPEVPSAPPAGLPSGLLERRADLVAAERRLAATLARVAEAKAALLPRISLTAAGGRTSAELADLLSSQFNVWSIAGNFAQPLFEGGRLQDNVVLTEARAREAVEGYRSAALQAFSEVETALASEEWLARREVDLKEAVEHSRAALRLAGDRYRLGLSDYVTLMETQRAAYGAESELIIVRRQRLENRVDLCLALGGGFGMDATLRRVEQIPSR